MSNETFVPEHNQALMTDITVPLFQLQQRIEKMESMLGSLQADLQGTLSD